MLRSTCASPSAARRIGMPGLDATVRLRQQEVEQRRRERSRPLEVRQVRGRQADRLARRDRARQHAAVAVPRHRLVQIAADHQRRRADRSQRGRVVQIPDRRAASGVADGIGREQHAPGPGDRRNVGRDLGRREEPARTTASATGAMPCSSTSAPPRLHRRRIGDARGGVGEHEVGQTIRRVERDPLAEHAADRQPAERERAHAERIGNADRIASELLEAVLAGGASLAPWPRRS